MRKKNLRLPIVIFFMVFLFLSVLSCSKENTQVDNNTELICDAKGSYSGTFTNQFGQSASHAYILSDYNFTTGAANLISSPTAFGSYSNTCDSIKIKLLNTINTSYYYFAGKFSNNRTTITGIYKNLTTPSETGPFTLTKQ